jgi:hypothetical protein
MSVANCVSRLALKPTLPGLIRYLARASADVGHRGGALVAVDGDAHQLGAGAPELGHLLDGGLDVGGVGVGHRLHDNGRAAADGHAANVHTHGLLARKNAHLLPVT